MKRLIALSIGLVACGGSAAPPHDAALVTVKPVASNAPVAPPIPHATPAPEFEPSIVYGKICVLVDGLAYCDELYADGPLIAPENLLSQVENATSFASGQQATCLTTTRGTVECYGDNRYGELGAKLDVDESPKRVPVFGVTHAHRVAAGTLHTCALLEDGAVMCWGDNSTGQTGSDVSYATEARALNVATVVPKIRAEQLSLGYSTSCARLVDGKVSCWGNHERPHDVAMLTGVTDLVVDNDGMCAVAEGKVLCWGSAHALAIPGDSSRSRSETPQEVPGVANARQVSLASDHACAVLGNGKVTCFGIEYDAPAMGRPAANHSFEVLPAAIVEGLPPMAGVVTSSQGTCAWTRDHELYCWGSHYQTDGKLDIRTPTAHRLR